MGVYYFSMKSKYQYRVYVYSDLNRTVRVATVLSDINLDWILREDLFLFRDDGKTPDEHIEKIIPVNH